MTPRESPALLQALALLDNPRGPRPRQGEPLPADVIGLLRIAAGDQDRLCAASQATGVGTGGLREAAVFYIQQVLFAPGSDSYRSLGVDPRAADDQIREHHRWLLRWLHPDRNTDPWEAIYAERVSRAWQDLRTLERRQRHDHAAAENLDSAGAMPRAAPPGIGRVPTRIFAEPTLERRAATQRLRWLPSLVFGTLAVSAVFAVVLLYAMHSFDARHAPGVADAALPSRPTEQPTDPVIEWPSEAVIAVSPKATPPAPAEKVAALEQPIAAAARPIAATAQQIAAPKPKIAAPESATLAAKIRASAPAPANPHVNAIAPVPAAPTARARPIAPVPAAPMARASPIAPVPAIAPSKPRSVPDVVPPAPPAERIAAVAPPPRAGLNDRIAYGLLGTFSEIYRQGDLIRLQQLLTDDARSARGGRDSLVAEYSALFDSSERRRLTVSNVSWLDNGQTASIIASFEASVVPRRGGRPRLSRGDLRLDLRLDEGQWRIYRLAHDEHRG